MNILHHQRTDGRYKAGNTETTFHWNEDDAEHIVSKALKDRGNDISAL